MTARRGMLGLVGFVALVQFLDSAQDPVGVLMSQPVTWSELGRRCLSPPPRANRADSLSLRRCHVLRTETLGATDDTTWTMARYLDTVITVFRSTVAEPPDTVVYDDVILAGRRGNEELTVIRWHARRDRSIEFLDTLIWRSTAHGTFLEIQNCLNGTGGCSMEYLHRRAGRWRPMSQPFLADLARRLPPSYSLHKGRRIDLATLSGTAPVALPTDGNCCPSYEIAFQLRLRGDALELVSATPPRRRSPGTGNIP